jgi:hypothetical protein
MFISCKICLKREQQTELSFFWLELHLEISPSQACDVVYSWTLLNCGILFTLLSSHNLLSSTMFFFFLFLMRLTLHPPQSYQCWWIVLTRNVLSLHYKGYYLHHHQVLRSLVVKLMLRILNKNAKTSHYCTIDDTATTATTRYCPLLLWNLCIIFNKTWGYCQQKLGYHQRPTILLIIIVTKWLFLTIYDYNDYMICTLTFCAAVE